VEVRASVGFEEAVLLDLGLVQSMADYLESDR
jgi:hypothetical protein